MRLLRGAARLRTRRLLTSLEILRLRGVLLLQLLGLLLMALFYLLFGGVVIIFLRSLLVFSFLLDRKSVV